MKFLRFVLFFSLVACSNPKDSVTSKVQKPKVSVSVTNISHGVIKNEINVSATTVYLNKQSVAAPLTSFVVETKVHLGMLVKKGQLLYLLESKEHHALKNYQKNFKVGIIEVKAHEDGVVTAVLQHKGSFVLEGAVLCEIADLNSLVFELNVPFEQMKYVSSNRDCTLLLPNDTQLKATVSTPLTSMNVQLQVQQVIARAKTPFLPEGLHVRALISKDVKKQVLQLLPNTAVQCDETMTKYWVMMVTNDSLAVKVPIKVGSSNGKEVSILSPIFTPSDCIVNIGSYALEDSTLVTITK